MHTLNFTTTINAPVSKVRDTMINHPTYEQWTSAFSEGSTYEGSWEKGSDIKFLDPSGHGGMIAQIADNRLYEYISIQHLGEIGKDSTITMYEGTSFENYSFTSIDSNTTKIDVEMTSMPDEWVDMFTQMRPKALTLLKDLCEK